MFFGERGYIILDNDKNCRQGRDPKGASSITMNEKNTYLGIYKVYLLFILFFTVASSILSTVLQLFFFDASAQNYLTSAPDNIELIPYIIIGVGFLVSLSVIFVLPKKYSAQSPLSKPSHAIKVASALVILSLVSVFVFQLVLANDISDRLSFVNLAGNSAVPSTLVIFHYGATALSVLSACYFAYDLFGKRKSVGFGIGALAFLSCYGLRQYFDIGNMLNNPRRALSILAASALLIFMLLEIKLLTDRPSKRLYVAFAMCAMLISLTSSVPSIILAGTGFYDDGIQTAYYLAEFALGLYAAVRLFEIASDEKFFEPEPEKVEEVTSEKTEEKNPEEDTATEDNITLEDEKTATEDAPLEIEHFSISREDAVKIYRYVYSAVASRKVDTKASEEDIKAETLALIETLLKDIENNEEAKEKVKQILAKSSEREMDEKENEPSPDGEESEPSDEEYVFDESEEILSEEESENAEEPVPSADDNLAPDATCVNTGDDVTTESDISESEPDEECEIENVDIECVFASEMIDKSANELANELANESANEVATESAPTTEKPDEADAEEDDENSYDGSCEIDDTCEIDEDTEDDGDTDALASSEPCDYFEGDSLFDEGEFESDGESDISDVDVSELFSTDDDGEEK